MTEQSSQVFAFIRPSPGGWDLRYRYLLLSAGCHLLAGLAVLRRPQSPTVPARSEIVVEKYAPQPGIEKSAGRSGGGGGQVSQGRLTFKDLGIGWTSGAGTRLPMGIGSGIGGSEGGGARGATAILHQMKHAASTERLWEAIDRALSYPPELQDASIEGFVEAKYRDGRLTVTSTSPYLRLLVRKTLKRALSEPLPASIKLVFLFQFELTRKENFLDVTSKALAGSAKSGTLGNHLSFYRSAKALGQFKIGPLSVFATSLAAGIDPGWFTDQVSNALSSKAKIDPLERYRRDPEWQL